MRKGSATQGQGGKPAHFGTPEWPTDAPQSLLFLRRGGVLTARKPSPWGEGAPVRTLGRMRGQGSDSSVFRRGNFAAISALRAAAGAAVALRNAPAGAVRAATYFAHGGKVGKTPPGTAPDEHFVLIVAFPRTPFYGGRQLGSRGSQRKGAGGSADRFPFYYRCR